MAAGWTTNAPKNPGSYGFRNAPPEPGVPAASNSPTASGPSRPSGSKPSGGSIPDISKILSSFSQPNQVAPAAPPPPPPNVPLVNTSVKNQTIDNTVLPALLSRAQGGMGADTAIRLASGGIRDAASGLMEEASDSASRRGVGGSGAEGMVRGKIAGQAQRDIAGASSNIAYKAEQDRNALYGSIAGIAQGAAGLEMQQQAHGLNQWQAQQGQQLSQQRYNLDQWQAEQQAAQNQQLMNQRRDEQLLNLLTSKLF